MPWINCGMVSILSYVPLMYPGANYNLVSLELHSDDKSRWVFERSGGLWLSFNLIMQPWVFGVSGEDPGMKGWDIIILNDDGKVTEIHAMIEGISTYAAAE